MSLIDRYVTACSNNLAERCTNHQEGSAPQFDPNKPEWARIAFAEPIEAVVAVAAAAAAFAVASEAELAGIAAEACLGSAGPVEACPFAAFLVASPDSSPVVACLVAGAVATAGRQACFATVVVAVATVGCSFAVAAAAVVD